MAVRVGYALLLMASGAALARIGGAVRDRRRAVLRSALAQSEPSAPAAPRVGGNADPH
jgi:hypothetical protein